MPSMNTAHPQPMPSATSTPAAAPKGRQPLMALDDALARLLASQGDLARSNQLLQEAVQLRGGQWPSLPLPSGH